ncbi:MAG: DUF3857 domain-containing protein [Candidatus Omnitrophota bacterium]|jgi:tetratricopeptide (TPR) repeat protein
MRIINTVKNPAFLGFIFLILFPGCIKEGNFEKAREYQRQSAVYYERAATEYRGLIKSGRDLDRVYLELGKLYYDRGQAEQAIGAFKNTSDIRAKKFLAISYYRLGNYTDALEIFSKHQITDDEYLYYYGRTCEKLNLFDKALEVYKKIKDRGFASLALERVNLIEKQVRAIQIKDISPEVNKLILASPGEDAYPQAGALILSCDEKIEVTAQNTQVASLHYIIKILNERGKEDFSETHIEYDSTYEKVELEYARTIKPDGTIAEVGTRHIRDVSKYLNFPLYSNARVYIISFPEVSNGAVIEYKMRLYRNELINKKDFVLSYPLQAGQPMLKANFSIDLPPDRALHIKTLNNEYNTFGADLRPRIELERGRLNYFWRFKDIPQIIPESNMPPAVQVNPAILISTFNSWEEVYQWWRRLARDKMRADRAIEEKVKALIRRENSPEARARAIYNFCAKEIRYVAVEYGQAGYEPHYAGDIFKNKYGDCKDQAILLVTMLREAGLNAWPVLIPTKESYNLNADFPSMLFNHAIAALQLEDKIIFLDPTAETCSFGDLPAGDQERQVLLIKEDKYEIENTPLYPAGHNLTRQTLALKVNSDETLTGRKSVFTQGIYGQGQRYWLLYTPPQLVEEVLKEKIQGISIGAVLGRYNIENLGDLNKPVVLDYEFRGTEYFISAGNLRVMPELSGLDTSLVAKDRRIYPLDFGVPDSREMVFEIEIPDNFVIKYIPDSVSEDTAWLSFIVEYSRKKNKLLFRQKIELKKTTVSTADYPDFKVFFEQLAKKIKQRVILEKVK